MSGINDDYQMRRDIEKLYDLIYSRTTDEQSPVTQKEEFDSFRDEVINNYATNESLNDLSNQLTELDNQKADKTEWIVIYDSETGYVLENNGIHCRLKINDNNISVTTSFNSILDLSDYTDYLPTHNVYLMTTASIIFRVNPTESRLEVRGDAGGTYSRNMMIEWTI